MKDIHIACPHCRADNHVQVNALQSSGGHVFCRHCDTVFKVYPQKKKAAPALQAAAAAVNPVRLKPDTQKLAAAIQAIRTNREAALASTGAGNPSSHSPFAILDESSHADGVQKPAHGQPSLPSISIMLKQNSPSALPVLHNSTGLPFDLLDSVASPQPASTHIHIERGNLVFTLLPSPADAAAPTPLLVNDARIHSEEIVAAQLALSSQQQNLHQQFNWTLASLVALTVLIVQLFYLMSVT